MNVRSILIVGTVTLFCRAQQDSRTTWDNGFKQARELAYHAVPAATDDAAQAKPQRPRVNKLAPTPKAKSIEVVPTPKTVRIAQPVPNGAPGTPALLGITIWRLRPSTASDDPVPRLLIHEPANGFSSVEWTPERVEAGTPFAEGDQVRLSIESLRLGYLYVVDREEYAGGRLGNPTLIFPTTRLGGGDNMVLAGRLVDIPAQGDNPPYFTVKRTRTDHIGELLYVLVTREPLKDLTSGPVPLQLSNEQLATWEARWGRRTDHMEMPGGAGKPWTAAEKAAGDGTRDLRIESVLTEDDPLPQTIYRVSAKPGDPVFVKVWLRVRN